MDKVIKVRQIITLKHWQNGSGWSYEEDYGNEIIKIQESDLNSIDWDWWVTYEEFPPREDIDTLIIVDFFAEDADIDEDMPLATHSKWASEIWEERYGLKRYGRCNECLECHHFCNGCDGNSEPCEAFEYATH